MTQDKSNTASDKQNQGENQTKSSSKSISKSQLAWIAAPIMVLVLIASLVTITAFTRSGNQSTLSKILDNVNQNEAALGVDALASSNANSLISTILKDGSSTDICSDNWDLSTLNKDPMWATSGGYASEIRPIAEKYNQSTYFASNFDYNLNLNTKQAYAQLTIDSAADLVEAKEVSKNDFEAKKAEYKSKMSSDPEDYDTDYPFRTDEDLNYGFSTYTDGDFEYTSDAARSFPDSFNMQASGQAIATVDTGYLYLDRFDITTDRFSSSNRLNNWYIQDWEIDDSQKSGVNDILDITRDLLATNVDDVASKSTAQEFATILCDGIKDNTAEVQKNDDYKISVGEKEYTVSGRKIVINTSELDSEKLSAQSRKASISLLEDAKFKDYLYSLYPTYIKWNEASNKISPMSDTDNDAAIMTQAEYQKSIDDYLEQSLKRLKDDSCDNGADYSVSPLSNILFVPASDGSSCPEDNSTDNTKVEDYVSINTDPVQYYINPESMNLIAFSSSTTFTFTSKAVDQMPAYLKPYLGEGFTLTYLAHDIAFNDNVPVISIPDSGNTKPFDDLGRDSKIEETLQQASNYN